MTAGDDSQRLADEINRLINRGLPNGVAMQVQSGELDEEFEVERWETRRQARQWAEAPEHRELGLTPLWDCEPTRFYLSLDGASPSEFDHTKAGLIDADVADIDAHLTFIAT